MNGCKPRHGLILSTLLCFTLLVSACAGVSPPVNNEPGDAPSSAAPTVTGSTDKPIDDSSIDWMAAIQASTDLDDSIEPDEKILTAYNRFAARLLLESSENSGSIMISPASVFFALSMTLNGADGQTRDQMLQLLTESGISTDDLNQSNLGWIAGLTDTGEKTIVSIANSIWFRRGFAPNPTFLQTNADFYRAGVRELDFADEQAPDIINNWVEQETNGLIEKIIEQINPSTVMFLINTIYFKSDWQIPFEKHETRNRTFYANAGALETEFMHRTGMMNVFSMDQAEGISLPYDDGALSFFALIPQSATSPREWLSRQNPAELFADIHAAMSESTASSVHLALPKFEAEYEDTLNNELIALGMTDAFDGAVADLSLLNEAREKGLYISEVRHKTVIKVDEKGTEAAAATSVAVDESAPMYDIERVFDRPFFYGIMDMDTGTPLFIGILENPTA